MNQEHVRHLALALPGVTEGAHQGHRDFRVGGTIFLGFSPDGQRANLKSTRVDLDAMCSADPDTFRNAWGGTWVGVDLARVAPPVLKALLANAHAMATKRATPAKPAKLGKPAQAAPRARKKTVTSDIFERVRDAARGLPGVEEGMAYGTPALRVRKNFLVRLREDGESLVMRVAMIERDHLMKSDPRTFFTTDHYRDYPAVLIHLAKVKPGILRQLLEQAWRRAAPKRLVAEHDAK